MISTGSMVVSKPPNLLVYHPDKDPTSDGFFRVKQALELCLTPERYVIYPLGLDDVLNHLPWKDSCKLLVVPPITESSLYKSHDLSGELPPRLVEEFVSFVQSGGYLLSLQPHLSQFLGLPALTILTPSQDDGLRDGNAAGNCKEEEYTVEVCEEGRESYQFSCLVPNSYRRSYNSNDVYLDVPLSNSIQGKTDLSFFLPKCKFNKSNSNQSSNKMVEQLIQLCDQSPDDVKMPCLQKIKFNNNGYAVISGFDLLPILPTGMELELLPCLNRGVAQRKQLLTALLKGFGLECSEERLPDLTHTLLLCSDKHRNVFLTTLSPLMSDGAISGEQLTLRFISDNFTLGTPVDDLPQPSTSELTIITQPAPWQVDKIPFSSNTYFRYLKTREIGRTLLHTAVITSTQLPFTGNIIFRHALLSEMGVAWVAAQQTQGKGRSGNAWISPLGSMMFTLPLSLSPSSRLSLHLPFLQHIVGIAVVDGIRSLPGYEDVPLRIKWPNDIYYKDRIKLGGILVSSMTMGQQSTAIIGCGVNVCNAHPTISINDIITLFNKETGAEISPLSVEQVLAWTFNCLERLLTLYEVQGEEQLLELYYKYWLHSHAEVILGSHGNEKATVKGIDRYGYLQVHRKSGEVVSLQPDGNSFDITKGLIIMKASS